MPQRMSSAGATSSSAAIFGVSLSPRAKLAAPPLRKCSVSSIGCGDPGAGAPLCSRKWTSAPTPIASTGLKSSGWTKVLPSAAEVHGVIAAGQPRADQRADERVRGGDGKAEPRGEETGERRAERDGEDESPASATSASGTSPRR